MKISAYFLISAAIGVIAVNQPVDNNAPTRLEKASSWMQKKYATVMKNVHQRRAQSAVNGGDYFKSMMLQLKTERYKELEQVRRMARQDIKEKVGNKRQRDDSSDILVTIVNAKYNELEKQIRMKKTQGLDAMRIKNPDLTTQEYFSLGGVNPEIATNEVFAELDGDGQGVRMDDLKRTLPLLAFGTTPQDVENMFRVADSNSDGVISIQEYYAVLSAETIVDLSSNLKPYDAKRQRIN